MGWITKIHTRKTYRGVKSTYGLMLNSSFSAIEKENEPYRLPLKQKIKKDQQMKNTRKKTKQATDQRNEKRLGNQLRLKSVNWYQARQTYTHIT